MGTFGAVLSSRALCRLTFPTEPFALCEAWVDQWMPKAKRSSDREHLNQFSAELNAYLTGALREFKVQVDLRGTPFQVEVWKALRGIRYGEVQTYRQIAGEIGRPRAVRAVGAANGANPVPIVVPCHRVVGSNGSLVGYAGGLDLKRILLEMEGRSKTLPGSAV